MKDSTITIFRYSEYHFTESSTLREMQYHQHNSLEISYVNEGQLFFEYFDKDNQYKSFYLRQNQLAIVKPYIKHKTSVSVGLQSYGIELIAQDNIIESIQKNLSEIDSTLPHFFDDFNDIVILQDTGNLQNTIRQFKNYANGTSAYTDILSDLEIKKLFVQIFLCSQKDNLIETNRYVNKAILYIKQNFNRNLTTEELAEHLGISPVYFQKIFHNATGMKFKKYLNKKRITYALNLLRSTNYTLTKIAKLVGYNNLQSFITNFKAIVGNTPKQYKDNLFHDLQIQKTDDQQTSYGETIFLNLSAKN